MSSCVHLRAPCILLLTSIQQAVEGERTRPQEKRQDSVAGTPQYDTSLLHVFMSCLSLEGRSVTFPNLMLPFTARSATLVTIATSGSMVTKLKMLFSREVYVETEIVDEGRTCVLQV